MLARLKHQLQREVRQHPRKAAVLAVLALVAVWRIAPLLAGPFGSASAAVASRSAVAPGSTGRTRGDDGDLESKETIESGKRVERLINWKLAGAALQSQPLLQSADRSEFRLDPFCIDVDQFAPPIAFVSPDEDAELWEPEPARGVEPRHVDAAAPAPSTAEAAPEKEPPPRVLRAAAEHPALRLLRLTAVLVTRERRLAVIAGRVYQTGAALRSAETEAATPQTFRVVSIGADGVVVESDDGQRYLLELRSRPRQIETYPANGADGGPPQAPQQDPSRQVQGEGNAAAEPVGMIGRTHAQPTHASRLAGPGRSPVARRDAPME